VRAALALGLLLVFAARPVPVAFEAAGEASFGWPQGLAIGPDGRVHVADRWLNRVVAADPESLIAVSEFGGLSLKGPRDLAFGPDGRAYVADAGHRRIAVFRPARRGEVALGGDWLLDDTYQAEDGPPLSLAVHPSGRLFAAYPRAVIAFEEGAVVRRLAGFAAPEDIAIDRDGALWVADTGHARLVRLSPDLSPLDLIDDPALGLAAPAGIAALGDGGLLVADREASALLRLGSDGRLVFRLTGEARGAARLAAPSGLGLIGARLFVADAALGRVLRYRLDSP